MPSGPLYSDISRPRQNLLDQVRQQQHSSPFRNRSNSDSNKRGRGDVNESVPLNKRKKVFWGKSNGASGDATDLAGPEVHEVFLFNYRLDVDDEKIKSHFVNNGVKVLFFKRISRDTHHVKNFLMKIARKEDFEEIIINVLPNRTGARWFVQDHDNTRSRGHPPSHFNKEMPVLDTRVPTTPVRSKNGPFSASIFSPAAMVNGSDSRVAVVNGSDSGADSAYEAEEFSHADMSPAVSVSNRFKPLGSGAGSPSFKVGGAVSLTSAGAEGNNTNMDVAVSSKDT